MAVLLAVLRELRRLLRSRNTHTPRLGVLWEEGVLKSGRREEAALHLFLSPGCSYVRAFCIFQTEARQKQHRARQVDVSSQFWEVALCLQEAPQSSSSGHSNRSGRQPLCTVGWPRSHFCQLGANAHRLHNPPPPSPPGTKKGVSVQAHALPRLIHSPIMVTHLS